jgi:hypothetical protein
MNTDEFEGHTEGPWHYYFFDGVDEKYHSVTWNMAMQFGIQLPVGHSADAKLIAAAPDLLKEVKRFEQVKKWVYAHKKYPTITKIHLKDLMDIIEGGAE